mgnify:CR=1 FL=1
MNHNIFYISNKKTLKNKIILIINIQKDIKKELIELLINCNSKIILLEKSINKTSMYYDKLCKNKKYIYVYFIDFLIATNKDYYKFSKSIYFNFGRIDGIIYDIPKLCKQTLFEQQKLEEFYKIMNINFYTKLIIIKSLIPLIKLSKSPSIIFTTHNINIPKTYWNAYIYANTSLQILIKFLQ